MTAVALADAGRAVTVVTKGALGDGSTAWAQGGLAAVLGSDDDADLHVEDTLVAGAGLCDEEAVRTLVAEAPAAVADLQALGARLDLAPDGHPALTREGGHSRNRIVHAAATRAARRSPARWPARCAPAASRCSSTRPPSRRCAPWTARSSVCGWPAWTATPWSSTGGSARGPSSWPPAGTARSTRPPPPRRGPPATVSLALRAGAEVADVEMVQFHPTVLWTGPGAEGQQTLISEAVRGEGAVLVDGSGRRIMVGAHPLADLAPRDVVSATIAAHLAAPATSTSGWTRPRSVPSSSPAASPASSAPAARPGST